MMTELKRAANSEKASERQALPEGTKIITIPVVEMSSNTNDNQQVIERHSFYMFSFLLEFNVLLLPEYIKCNY
jgi:hypothetical protein